MENFKCYYCEESSERFSYIVDHTIDKHGDMILKVKVAKVCPEENKMISKTKNFSIIPNDLKSQNKVVNPVEESKTIRISNFDIFQSPIKKVPKLTSTPIKKNTPPCNEDDIDTDFTDIVADLNEYLEDMSLIDDSVSEGVQTDDCIVFDAYMDESTQQMIEAVLQLLPDVLNYLKTVGKEEMYLTFTKLLAEQRLPLTNIAFLLFMDVVQWFSIDNTHRMRYSEEVKQFWNIGLKLFKGRFLRFMSGWKNQGQNAKGNTKSENSCINFAVPSRTCLDDSYISKELQNIKPGILCNMIELVSGDDEDKKKTFKVCVDGKKINTGIVNQKYGDINLWGLEGPPSLAEEEIQLDREQAIVHQLHALLDQLDKRDIAYLNDATDTIKEQIWQKGKECIGILSRRIMKLRQVKQKKVVTLERLKCACTNEQLRSKYSYALSAIKTHVYQINACIKGLLKSVDSLGEMSAVCNGVGYLFQSGQYSDLSCQQNYKCLTGPAIESVSDVKTMSASTVKQRSELWFEIRKLGKVTGSTCFKALGLSGLKKMKEHYENAEDPSLSTEETQKRMKYGVDNEINAIATLVGKVLPAFLPKATYFEEGCEIVEVNAQPFLIVSSDGTIRDSSNNVLHAVEVKCPYPGKIYTTPVYYKIPWYYATQVLSEIYSLKTQSLMFICYSEESTTVFEASYDADLWEEIMTRLLALYGNKDLTKLRKLPQGLSDLKEKILRYCDEKVRFIAELPSLKCSRQCFHTDTSSEEKQIGHHAHGPMQDQCNLVNSVKSCTVSELLTDLHSTKEGVSEAYSLCRRAASEVLVFLISDLDRIHEVEKQYAVPIAYALKGYSLTSDMLRQMLNDVLHKCFELGIYAPAVSYDGQWSKLAVRSRTGVPLTKLQLQKDVYKEAKKTTRKEIVDVLKQSNIIRAVTMKDVEDQIICNIHTDSNNYFIGSLQLYRSKTCKHVFETSVSVKQMLKSKHVLPQTCDEENDSESNVLLDNISPVIAEEIEDDVLDKMNKDATTNASNTTEPHLEISHIFESDNVSFDEADNQTVVMDTEMSNEIQSPVEVIQESGDMDYFENTDSDYKNVVLTVPDKHEMLKTLCDYVPAKWKCISYSAFEEMFQTEATIAKSFTRCDLQTCIRSISAQLKNAKIHFALSWKKNLLVAFMYRIMNDKMSELETKQSKIRRNPSSLKTHCIKRINKFPKYVLSSIYAEYLYPSKQQEWQNMSPFTPKTTITGMEDTIVWYSMPEYVDETYTYLFGLLDAHHLFVNARVKCCSTGMSACGIHRNAWVKVATKSTENNCGLNLALVEDLVDKQSSAFAQKTFSLPVEKEMRINGDIKEADFCKNIREWYSAEDDPGIDILERTRRRLAFREWLLEGVDFSQFPPPGTHVKGIPHVMFEGILTNIERRIQIIPFVKSGAYNPRSLGSLEAENFFGEFQDLDPKGSGVIRPDDIPKAIATACELIGARLDPNRKFFMHTSQAKVYPAHQLSKGSDETSAEIYYMTPSIVDTINPRNHLFDQPSRAERKSTKRKSGEISRPGMTSRGARPVREHHRCDESKVLPHIRLGIDVKDL